MLTIDRAIPQLTRNHSAQKPNSDNLKLPELDKVSTRAYSSRQRHKSSLKHSDSDDDLVPGFRKCKKPVKNGRSWSAKPKEEGLAARAKWEVLYEVR